jgi:2-polyprenyl-6-methoxyphenol hydroxylase-like FAD-dependent oxidoreductase
MRPTHRRSLRIRLPYVTIPDMESETYDVVIVGAGVAGMATALEFSRQRANVLLIESSDAWRPRIAGELIHPHGVQMLKNLGVHIAGAYPVRGFLLYPHDKSTELTFSYGPGKQGLSCEHEQIVDAIRDRVLTQPGIEFCRGARATRITKDAVVYVVEGKERRAVGHRRVVAATGHTSLIGDAAHRKKRVSRMMGLSLRGAQMKDELRGNIVLGRPGPIAVYRVAPDVIRAFVDVPLDFEGDFAQAYAPLFPPELRAAFRDALVKQEITWSANYWQPRLRYEADGVAVVGDATGVLHPLTACGITLALEDARALIRSSSLSAYRRRRIRETRTSETVAVLMSTLSASSHAADRLLLGSLYAVARAHPKELVRTTRMMAAEITSPLPFVLLFGTVLATALFTIRDAHRAGGERERSLSRVFAWAKWGVTPRHKRPHVPTNEP